MKKLVFIMITLVMLSVSCSLNQNTEQISVTDNNYEEIIGTNNGKSTDSFLISFDKQNTTTVTRLELTRIYIDLDDHDWIYIGEVEMFDNRYNKYRCSHCKDLYFSYIGPVESYSLRSSDLKNIEQIIDILNSDLKVDKYITIDNEGNYISINKSESRSPIICAINGSGHDWHYIGTSDDGYKIYQCSCGDIYAKYVG